MAIRKVTWLGCPVSSTHNKDKFTPAIAWVPGHQIGLREDGVVV